jgi:hypothetical protein
LRPFLAILSGGFRSLQTVIVSEALLARLSLAAEIPFLAAETEDYPDEFDSWVLDAVARAIPRAKLYAVVAY